MNYESTAKKPTPFKGLSVQLRRRLVVYLCYIATPAMTPDEVRQRWGEVLSADDWPLAHEAMDLIDEIKKELLKRKRRRSIMCAVIWTSLVLLIFGVPVFMALQSQQAEEEARRQEEMRRNQEECKRKEAEECVRKRREADAAMEKAQDEARRREESRRECEEKQKLNEAKEAARIAKASAESAKQDMRRQCNKAKRAGAKEHAVTEWNRAIGKWNSGDDKFKNGDYVGALELYHLSESLFVEAERISQSRKAVKLTAKLSELQGKASALVEESDKWWKWSVDDSALLEMGNAINKSLYEGENIPSFSIAKRNELEMLLVRCYELASKGGSGEASFRLALLYGAAENLVNPYSGVVIRRDNKLAEQYLKRAIAQKHALAKSLYDVMH